MGSETGGKYIENLSLEELFGVVNLDELELRSGVVEKAKNGDVISQLEIANVYLWNGSYHHAKAWYLRLSEKNHALAQFMLGKMYGNGYMNISETCDFKEAEKWFEKAYHNDPQNSAELIRLYYHKIARYEKEAFQWFIKGGANGNALDQYWVGKFFNKDEDTFHRDLKMDKNKAIGWFQKSADQGFTKAIEKVKELNNEGYYSVSKIREAMTVDQPNS